MKWLFFLLLLPLSYAYYDAEQLLVDVEISNTLHVIPKTSEYELSNAAVHLTFYPKQDFRQDVLSIRSEPPASNEDGAYLFRWDSPSDSELPFMLDSRVMTKNLLPRVGRKVDFPILDLEGNRKYTVVTPTIDYDDEDIMELASELAYGEEDLYVLVHKLAEWVNLNIEYSLNSKTSDASQKASWVMANRIGVCDELTNLFIGLCRSLGIPARFVTGVSYSNLDLVEPWSPHGWAEVYFPGYGWIPFDVTYGEFGYIDSAHIKFKDALDANRSSISYEWEGYDVAMSADRLKIHTSVAEEIGTWKPLVELETGVLKDEIGFGSYNAVYVQVTNPHSYYVPTEITLARAQGLEFYEGLSKYVLLEPHESKRLNWITRIGRLDDGFIYNFTVSAYSVRNATSSANMICSDQYKTYSLGEIRELVDVQSEEASKDNSESLEISCQSDDLFYIGEIADISCNIHNIGDEKLSNLDICLEKCQKIDLERGQRTEIEFSKYLDQDGPYDMIVIARNDAVTRTASVRFNVWSRPKVVIDNIIYPTRVAFSDKFQIEFRIRPETTSIPQNVKISLVGESFEKEWFLDELKENRKYILNVDEYALSDYKNEFKIYVLYSDKMGKEYSETASLTVNLEDLSMKEKGVLLLNKLNSRLSYDFLVVVLAVIIAMVIINIIFKIKSKE